ncbi:MAG: MBL fold metallo-hydrolase [Acetobacteraceae bacterium]|nr:MBL fold metallo-hydrolase [Acetobacteraceae bacterium]
MTTAAAPTSNLQFPIAEPPEVGSTTEVAPGILWLRLALPFRLDHVNVYLLEDGPGWAVVDTGIGNDETKAIWQGVLADALRGRAITRVIVTHFHPDHAGMAGWLCAREGARLHMSQTEYLASLVLHLNPEMLESEPYRGFYRDHGLAPDVTTQLLGVGHRYLRMLTGLPRTFRRMIAGEKLVIGGRPWEVLTGGGHSPEQVMLYCPADRLLLAADQIMARISPNISVQAMDPAGDPLGIYIRSLKGLKETVAENVFVLPGHNLPFYGLHRRADELLAHHRARCDAILEACREQEHTAAELLLVVFRRPIDDPHQMGFAFSETLAHVNYLERLGRLRFEAGRYRAI